VRRRTGLGAMGTRVSLLQRLGTDVHGWWLCGMKFVYVFCFTFDRPHHCGHGEGLTPVHPRSGFYLAGHRMTVFLCIFWLNSEPLQNEDDRIRFTIYFLLPEGHMEVNTVMLIKILLRPKRTIVINKILLFLLWLVLRYWSLNSGPTPWATPPAFFFGDGFFENRVLGTICPGWLWTLILQIYASWVVRITGASHRFTVIIFKP
jgi:hypothetical protein